MQLWIIHINEIIKITVNLKCNKKFVYRSGVLGKMRSLPFKKKKEVYTWSVEDKTKLMSNEKKTNTQDSNY